jgi:hypothetical protein
VSIRQTKGATATQAIMDVKTRIAGALSVKTKHHVSPETMTVDQLIRAASKAGLKLAVSIEGLGK